MRSLILFILILISAISRASTIDSFFQRHEVIVSETDGISHQFSDGPSGATVHEVVTSGSQYYPKTTDTKYLPNYVLHIHFKYSYGLTKHIRLETGLGYMFEGFTLRASYVAEGEFLVNTGSYKGYQFIRKFTIPIHVKFMKPIGRGAFTCTLGPSFTLPVQSFIKENHFTQNGNAEPNITVRVANSPASTAYRSSMGFDLKMGYERYYNKRVSLDIGPVVNVSDLVLLDKNLGKYYRSSGYRPYQYYIGLDVAVNFGMKK